MKKFWKNILSFWFLTSLECACYNSIYDVKEEGNLAELKTYIRSPLRQRKMYVKPLYSARDKDFTEMGE